MKHTKEEILNALRIIKDECRGTVCKYCPFSDDTLKCLVREHPYEWDIKEEKEELWRAFENDNT
jgi:hypothetical protein